jgi:hypothetical protein
MSSQAGAGSATCVPANVQTDWRSDARNWSQKIPFEQAKHFEMRTEGQFSI